MAKLHIHTYGDEVLRKKTKYVKIFDKKLQQLVDDMFHVMVEMKGIGLAAPQVGILKKLIVVDTGQEGEKIALANPKLLWSNNDPVTLKEGCLSIPGLEGEVQRPSKIRVQGNVPATGEEMVVDASDLFARVILHEMDHLNGILFIDHLPVFERAALERRLQELAAA